MTDISATAWSSFSACLDRALDLSESERAPWLEALAAQHADIATAVAAALAVRLRPGFTDFLRVSPLPTVDDIVPTMIGRRVGPYVIEAEVGGGGMGSVWRASRADGRFEGTVAIKFVHVYWLGRSGEQRFRSEGRLLGRLDHPNIARLIDAGVLEDSQPYLVLEYVDGESIDAYCDRLRLGVQSRVTLFQSVLAAVGHAHGQLVIHRDLKPANVFVTRDGVVKLLDFGIAKLLGDDAGAALTQTSAQALTPQYAAPEQLLGKPVTTATDVYGLGLVLYTLLTGRHPYEAALGSSVELIRAVLSEEPPRASAVLGGLAAHRRALEGDLDNILAKALKKDPAERYTSVGAFAEDLRRFLANEPVQARPDSARYRVAKFVRRNRASVIGGLLAACALIAASAFALVQMLEARAQRDLARSELRRAEAANDFSSLMLEELGANGKLPSREQLLDRGVALLDARYDGDRAFVADMLTQLAGRYGDAARVDRAISLTQRAIGIARLTDRPTVLALTLCEGARWQIYGGAHADVGTWLAEAQALMNSVGEVPMRLSVACLKARAEAAKAGGRWDEAESLLNEAHARQVSEGITTGLEYTSVLNDLGHVYFDEGRYPAAYRMALDVGAAFDRGGRGATVGRRIIHENAASSLVRMGEPRAALAELEAAHLLVGGRSAPEVPLGSRRLVALTLRRMGRPHEARAIIAAAVGDLAATGNPMLLSNALLEDAAVEADLGDTEVARTLIERAIASMSKDPMGREQSLAQAHALLADLDTRAGRAQAARLGLEAFLQGVGYPGRSNRETLEPALLSAARTALALDDLAAAESYANDALAIAEGVARGPDSSADVGEILMVLARIRIAAKRPQEAAALLGRALRCFSNGLGMETSLTEEARRMLRAVSPA